MTTARQWLSKHVPAEINAHTTIEHRSYASVSNHQICKQSSTTMGLLLRSVFSVRSAQNSYKGDNWANPVNWVLSAVQLCKGGWKEAAGRQFWTRVGDGRTWAWEAGVSPLLEAAAREQLVKTRQARKSLASAMVKCELWRLVVAL
jgi:hypothetical protein